MKKIYELLVKLSDLIFIAEKWLLTLAVVVMVTVNFINVCLRRLAGSGLSYCETLSVVLFVFMVVFGGNIAIKSDGEIKIDIFNFHNEKANAALHIVQDVIASAAIIFCIIGLISTVKNVMVNLQRVTPLPIYTYHIYIGMTIGFCMMLLDRIILFVKHVLTLCGQQVEGGAKTI